MDAKIEPAVTRRRFNTASLLSLVTTIAATFPVAAQPAGSASNRREVIKQRLPGELQRWWK